MSFILDYKVIEDKLLKFIKEKIAQKKINKIVIGLSGGIDSTVVAYLCLKAVGSKNIFGVLLPYKTSSLQHKNDAIEVAGILGINYDVIDITNMVDVYTEKISDISNTRKGNIMARQRMIVLFDISHRENGIVVGTSNKTEILLGYGTIYGDVACGINPIGNLYKTQIWELGSYLQVPKKIIEKKPTADLWIGQTDEDELGFSYLEVDKLLYHLIDEKKSEDEILQLGFKKEFIEKVKIRIEKNRFKSQLPEIASI